MSNDPPILPGLSPIDGLDIHTKFEAAAPCCCARDASVSLSRPPRRAGRSSRRCSPPSKLAPH